MNTHSHARRSRGGFTLIELVIATVIMSLILGTMGIVQMRARDASRAGMQREQVETTCRRALDRVTQELQGVVKSLIFPDPSTALGTSTITYQHPTGVSAAGVVSWDLPSSLSLELEPGEIDNGLDDNGNGLIDERCLVLTRNVGGPNQTTTVLCSGIPELAEGEVANGLDDNGNGVVDEAGFNVRKVGDLLTVRLTVQEVSPTGEIITSSLQTSLTLHN